MPTRLGGEVGCAVVSVMFFGMSAMLSTVSRVAEATTVLGSRVSAACFSSCEVPLWSSPLAVMDVSTSVTPAPAARLALAQGHTLFQAGQQGGLWRVVSGVVRLDQAEDHGRVLVMLAQAGDVLGFETLCGQAFQLQASALTDVVLQPMRPPCNETERQQWLMEALLQQPQRSHDMARLRTGPVAERLDQLLRLLLGVERRASLSDWVQSQPPSELPNADALRDSLPPLRVLAEVVDAKHETVCRALALLLPPRTRKSGPKPPSRWSGAATVTAAATVAAIERLTTVGRPGVLA